MKLICRLQLCFMLILVAACAAPVARFQDESAQALVRISSSNVINLFPVETEDLYHTIDQGDRALSKGDVAGADSYYNLALGKAEILDALFLKELKRREEAARLEFELKRQAEAELQLQRKLEREKAAQALHEAARLRKIEAEKAEARRKFERHRQEKEKEILLVARHTVKRGETLPQIASQPEVYGDSSLWPLIYRANRDQISNPGVLWPGQILRIPRNYGKDDVSEARRFSAGRPLR